MYLLKMFLKIVCGYIIIFFFTQMYLLTPISADNRYDPDFVAVLLCMDRFIEIFSPDSCTLNKVPLLRQIGDHELILSLVSLSVSLKSLNLHVFFFHGSG